MTVVDIGIFAHNEAGTIAKTLESLLRQDIFVAPGIDVKVHVLANGCTDETVREVHSVVLASQFKDTILIHDLHDAGKSRTWNKYVHDLSRSGAQYLIFMDADIWIPKAGMLRALVHFVQHSTSIDGASSQAIKDIVYNPSLKKGMQDNLIVAAGGTLNDWKSSIIGSLHILKASVARSFHVPIGLPVEDGFIRAMVQTRNFIEEGGPENRLGGHDDLFHVYESYRSVRDLVKHQTRIVIGSAINSAIFSHIRHLPPEERLQELKDSAVDPRWLRKLLTRELPRAPYGYVPFHFLFKRIFFWARSPDKLRIRRMVVLIIGFCFDAVVYVRAQYFMWRGTGAGYW